MKCSCPKCSALLAEHLSNIPEKGKSGKCSECGGSYWIHRESFILRCYAVTGERYCSNCGEALGSSTYCPGCGTLYPDYCVVSNKKPVKRVFEKKQFSLSLSPQSSRKSAEPGRQPGVKSVSRGSGASGLRNQLLIVGAGIALLAAIAVVALLYMQDRAEGKFSRDFVVALYGVKSGTDQCLKKSDLLASGTRLTDNDIAQLKALKGEVTNALQVLSPPPEKFRDAHNRLLSLAETYEKFHNLCITSGPTAEIADTAKALDSQIINQAIELKDTLPPKLLAELTTKATRYSNLQFMLK